jgi:hypothetical protein
MFIVLWIIWRLFDIHYLAIAHTGTFRTRKRNNIMLWIGNINVLLFYQLILLDASHSLGYLQHT